MNTMPRTSTAPQLAFDLHSQDGPPVLLIVGFSMVGRMWSALTPHLTPDFSVATFDNRGVGGSDAPDRAWTMIDMADDAARVLDALGWDTAHIVAVSMGGMIAQHLALRHRARLRSLTLIATQPGGKRAILPRTRGIGTFLRANIGSDASRFSALKQLLYTPEFITQRPPDFDASLLDALSNPPPPRVRQIQLRAILGHDARPHLHKLADLPTLLIRPDRDLLVRPAQSDLLHRLIPNSRLIPFPQAGHGLIRQDPEGLAATLREHILPLEARA